MKRNGIRAGINEISESFSIRKLRGSDYVLPSEHDIEVFKKLAAGLTIRPLISVVVPAYNTDPWGFEGMLDSVLTQAYDNIELIIADASDDKSILKAVCDSKSDSRIKYLTLSQNKGISDNTNQVFISKEVVSFRMAIIRFPLSCSLSAAMRVSTCSSFISGFMSTR